MKPGIRRVTSRRSSSVSRWARVGFASAVVAAIAASAALASGGPPVFTKAFSPDTVGNGTTSMLIFTIDNSGELSVAEELAFDDELPFGLLLADVPLVSNDCFGTLETDDGDSDSDFDIRLTDGMVGAGETCQVIVNTIGTTDCGGLRGIPVECENESGDLTSTLGNSGSASATLFVDIELPSFSKSFSPATVPFGGRSTLTFDIDSSTSTAFVTTFSFIDVLPSGMVVANPSNASTDCFSSDFVTVPGTDVVTLSGSNLAGGSCTASVDVIGGAVGKLENSVDLFAAVFPESIGTFRGKATAVLDVTGFVDPLVLEKDFTDDPVPPGGTVNLEFTVRNLDRGGVATGITFVDDLEDTLTGLAPSGPLPTEPCGAGSSMTFAGGDLTLLGGTVPPEGTCTFSVELAVPSGAVPATYPNTAGPVSGTVGGMPETGNVAGSLLHVVTFPVLTKTYMPNPAGSGGTVTLEFTITNPDATTTMSGVTFFDDFNDIHLTSPSGAPAPGFCGPSSTATFTPHVDNPPPAFNTPARLTVMGASLAEAGMLGDSCTFSIVLDVEDDLGPGTYPNLTSEISAVLDDFGGTPTVIGPPAADDLVVVGAPELIKEFVDDPVLPGASVSLEFTLRHSEAAVADAIGIAFTDDLTTLTPALAGLMATGIAFNTCTGSTVDISTPTFIDFSGLTLMPGEECSVRLDLSVPAAAAADSYENTTSSVTATVSGIGVTGDPAANDLLVTPLVFTKDFTDDPVIAGEEVTLEFKIENLSSFVGATGIIFSDVLDDVIAGLAPSAPLPAMPCGPSSTLVFVIDTLTLIAGEVPADDMCMFEVTLLVPPGTPDGGYPNLTSDMLATIGGSPTTLPPAFDELLVNSTLVSLTKEFMGDPVPPGGSVTLEFTLENLSTTETVTDIDFSDDLDAALSGLEAASPVSNSCPGMATSPFPSGVFAYEDAELGPSEMCKIVIAVDVPDAPLLDAPPFINTTSSVTADVGPLSVFGDPGIDELEVQLLTLDKSFDGATVPGGTVDLTFTLENLDATAGVANLSFSDDLNAVFPGLVATVLPPNPVCDTGTIAGTSFLTVSGASLDPSGTCSFDVTVMVPGSATGGSFPNTTSPLFQFGVLVADPATAFLEIEPPPTFAKSFAPNPIDFGLTSTLTFTIDNSASSFAATDLDFTDMLPAGLVVAIPSGAATTCTGGTLTAVAGSTVVSYTGGSVAAGATCEVMVDVRGLAVGALVNTSGDLTSSSGNSGPASDTLTVNALASLDYGDAPDPTFPTVLASDGARHGISPLVFMGALVDSEVDGQTTPEATGDDDDGTDDEDGVIFTTPLRLGPIGMDAEVDVIASGPGFLNAWIDFNRNGSWADAGEQIFTDEPLFAGVNSLMYTVPAGAELGCVVTRFRFSSLGGDSFDGAAADGEVEDYADVEVSLADDIEIINRIIAVSSTFQANNSIAIGGEFVTPDVFIVPPADVVFHAGEFVVFRDGVVVEEDATVSVLVGPLPPKECQVP